MAHRGRLNVLANIIGKSYRELFKEFEGDLDPDTVQGSGDVKYHKGATGTFVGPHNLPIPLTLASNPSHLEAVDPVVEGMARAKQDLFAPPPGVSTRFSVLSLLIHGDAAFAGQGVVAETLNLSMLPGLPHRRHGPPRHQQPGRLHHRRRSRRARRCTQPTSRRWCRRRSST